MSTTTLGYRLSAATGIHRGDRAYQQDQVEILHRPAGTDRRRCPLAIRQAGQEVEKRVEELGEQIGDEDWLWLLHVPTSAD